MKNKAVSPAVREGGRLVLTLFAITAAAALILSLVYAMTADRIARGAEERRQAALSAVVPGADIFSQLPYDPGAVDNMYAALKGGTLMGYCVEVAPGGFSGPIRMLVGVSGGGAVLGVNILELSETAGLGANVREEDFLRQYLGLSGTVRLGTGDNGVDAVTGATISSRAVTEGVNRALAAVADYQTEGGMDIEEGAFPGMD